MRVRAYIIYIMRVYMIQQFQQIQVVSQKRRDEVSFFFSNAIKIVEN